MRATSALVGTAAAVALLAACGTDQGSDPVSAPTARGTTTSLEPTAPLSSTGSPTTHTSADEPADGEPPFPESTAHQTAENSGEWNLVLQDVRAAHHDSFDRIVLEFTGTGVPGWTVNYVDAAVLDGSGEAVPLGGDAFLDIYASGTTYPESAGDYYSGPREFEPETGGVLTDVYVGGTFEGYTQVLVGIDDDRVPFRVFALTHPSRLVVDVVDTSTD